MMNGRDRFEPEVEQGPRTPTSGSDRVLLVLAVLVLLGGLGIAVRNLLPDEVAVAEPTPHTTPGATVGATPHATGQPTASATPAMPRRLTLVPAATPSGQTSVPNIQGWLRVTKATPVRNQPAAGAEVVGDIPAGGVALTQTYADTVPGPVPGWVWVLDPAPSGWVAIGDGTAGTVEQYPLQQSEQQRILYGILPGGGGFLGFGEDQRGTSGAPWLAFSRNGTDWKPANLAPDVTWIASAASGPAGWLAIGFSPQQGAQFQPQFELWQSSNGTDWTVLGGLQGALDLWPRDLVATDAGYLLSMSGQSPEVDLFFSANGETWTEVRPLDTGVATDLRMVGTPFGFYVWTVGGDPPDDETIAAAFSANGLTWPRVDGGPQGSFARVAATAAGLVGMDNDPQTGRVRTWTGVVSTGNLTWHRADAAVFGPRSVSLLVGGGGSTAAFLWDEGNGAVKGWETRDGVTWTELGLPDGAFPTSPTVGAIGPAGLLVEGQRTILGRRTADLWTLGASGWTAAEIPSLLPESPPQPTACPPPPRDALDFLQIDPGFATYCFGNSPLTFPAWIVPCTDCQWEPETGYAPAWLADPGLRRVTIAPIDSEPWYFLDIVAGPDLVWDTAWEGARVELTGHFDDPASTECRYTGTAREAWSVSAQRLRDDCARRFVITGVTPRAGP